MDFERVPKKITKKYNKDKFNFKINLASNATKAIKGMCSDFYVKNVYIDPYFKVCIIEGVF